MLFSCDMATMPTTVMTIFLAAVCGLDDCSAIERERHKVFYTGKLITQVFYVILHAKERMLNERRFRYKERTGIDSRKRV